MFSRRELLNKVVSAALLSLSSKYQSTHNLPEKYPAPMFQIGDKVSDHWVDDFGENSVEFGEIVGICWHPYEKVWAYHITWTSGKMDAEYYPCFDEHLVVGGDLRFVDDELRLCHS
jgi:hypothetical protein